jgi:restriction system protein
LLIGEISNKRASWAMYEFNVWHDGLGKRQVVRARTREEAQAKAEAKKALWNAQYARLEARGEREAMKEEAIERTEEAEQVISELTGVLRAITDASPVFELEKQRTISQFLDAPPKTPNYYEMPKEPTRAEWQSAPIFDWLDNVFAFRRNRKIRLGQARAEENFASAHAAWSGEFQRRAEANKLFLEKHNARVSEWAKKKAIWEADRDRNNAELDHAVDGLKAGNAKQVEWLFDNVWNLLPLPEDVLSGEYQLHFDEAAKTLIIDLDLPEVDSFPSTKSFRYVASRKEIEEVKHKESFVRGIFDDFVYQLALAVPHAFFACDVHQAVQAIVFNGWVTYVNRATGNNTTACIASLHCEASELLKINLRAVDAKACFRALKGVASPQISSLTPVRPIINVDRNDRRFVNSQNVISDIDGGTNLAAIGWEEFEHLIRELFEKEFSSGGGEVKVTQASRDGGVDAVAFDPDPIRGGKIVIQAKRYTNTVDVSAVRDLYGTVHSEGATKGILVTTSGFGPDAHRFAKGKPLTLLDGNNLLFLLAKHGVNARIDLAEAKKLGNALLRSQIT